MAASYIIWVCLVAASMSAQSASGYAIIENQTATWQSAGMGEYFARSTDDIIPPVLWDRVYEEVLLFEKHEREERAKNVEGGTYMHGKGGTYWRPLFDSMLIYQSDIGMTKHDRIMGGEWWVQRRDEKEDIGFHHDKDEALASNKATMKFPEISTVTYLSDLGGPTLIFNQTTKDGNNEVPVIPSRGFLSYPKMNRHMMFRGNLQHGVPGHLALPSTTLEVNLRGSKRITFLINWWNSKPLGPNCNKVESKLVKELGVYDRNGLEAILKSPEVLNHKPVPVQFETLFLPKDQSMRTRHAIKLAGHDMIWYDLPTSMRSGAFQIEWEDDQIFGNMCYLDLNSPVVGALFSEPRHKVLVFVSPSDERAASKYVLPLAKKYHENFKFVFADPARTQNAMNAFGLSQADAPIAVIHSTHPMDKKYLPPPDDRKLSEVGLKRLVESFIADKLGIASGSDVDNGDALNA